MTGYNKLIEEIIEQMKEIVGPVAVVQAKRVKGLKVEPVISIQGDSKKVIQDLLEIYKRLMGPVALTIAKKGVKKALEDDPKMEVPEMLK